MTSFYFPVGHPSDPECRKDLRNGTINQAANEVPSFPNGAESGHACGWMGGSNLALELSNFYPEKKFTQPSPLKEVDLKFPVFIMTIKGSQCIHAELKQNCPAAPAARALYSPSLHRASAVLLKAALGSGHLSKGYENGMHIRLGIRVFTPSFWGSGLKPVTWLHGAMGKGL